MRVQGALALPYTVIGILLLMRMGLGIKLTWRMPRFWGSRLIAGGALIAVAAVTTGAILDAWDYDGPLRVVSGIMVFACYLVIFLGGCMRLWEGSTRAIEDYRSQHAPTQPRSP